MYDRRVPTNVCRFVGQLHSYSVSVINGHPLGKGELRLPDVRNNQVYQIIKFLAWYDVAYRIQEFPEGSWVELLTSYTPNNFRGNIKEEFTVSAAAIL